MILEKYTLEDFVKYCIKGICLRSTFVTANCIKKSKRRKCYTKYLEKIDKLELKVNADDEEWIDVCERVDTRDVTCRIWGVLEKEEKQVIMEIYRDEYKLLSKILDHCHIIPRGKNKDLFYDENNIVLVSRYFHNLLDSLRHPITRAPITKEERLQWFRKALKGKQKKEI